MQDLPLLHEVELGAARAARPAAAAAEPARPVGQQPPLTPSTAQQLYLRCPGPPLERQAAAALRLVAWLALLFVGYGFQRGLCAGGIPYDCDDASASDIYSALTILAFTGGGLGWLAGVTQQERFAWLAAPSRAYLWAAYLALFPAYGGLSNVSALQASLASTSWHPAMYAVVTLGSAAALAALAFHLWLALSYTWGDDGANMGVSGSNALRSGSSSSGGEQRAVAPGSEAGRGGATLSSAPAVAHEEAGNRAWTIPSARLFLQHSDSGNGGDSGSGGGGSSTGRLQSAARSSSAGNDSSAAADDGGSSHSSQQPLQLLQGRRSTAMNASRQSRANHTSRCCSSRAPPQWRCLALYLLPRLAVLAYFAAWLAALPASGAYSLHLHHYALGWGVAIFAAFNHPLSGLVLALATAVFVQGGAAYGFDPIIQQQPASTSPGGCLPVSSSTGQLTCVFWSGDPFDLRFCSSRPWIPWFDCSLPWPWPSTAVVRNGSGEWSSSAAVPVAGAPLPATPVWPAPAGEAVP